MTAFKLCVLRLPPLTPKYSCLRGCFANGLCIDSVRKKVSPSLGDLPPPPLFILRRRRIIGALEEEETAEVQFSPLCPPNSNLAHVCVCVWGGGGGRVKKRAKKWRNYQRFSVAEQAETV